MERIHEATEGQADRVAKILAEAFGSDPLWTWVFPDAPGREAVLPRFFRVFVDQALATDRALIAEPDLGAALWIRMDEREATTSTNQGQPEDGDDEDEFPPIYDPYLDRLKALDERLEQAHPTSPTHLHLPLIGVRADARGAGFGSALLTHRLGGTGRSGGRHATPPAQSDDPDYPVYLEATSERNKALYERHGFHRIGTPIHLPNGPTLYPMWRDPNTATPEGAR